MKYYLASSVCDSIDKMDLFGRKRVAFIATAAEPYDDKHFVENDREALLAVGLIVDDIDIKGLDADELFDILQGYDIIFVAGGNTFYLLEHMNRCGFKDVMGRLDDDVLYIGSSAGSVIVAPDIGYIALMDDPSKATLDSFESLGLVDIKVLPHYGRAQYAEKCRKIIHDEPGVITLTDEQVLAVDGDLVIKL